MALVDEFSNKHKKKLGIIDIDSPSFFFPSLLSPYVSFFVVFYRLRAYKAQMSDSIWR